MRDTVDTTPTAELAPEIFAAIQDLGFDTLTLRYLDRSVPDHLQDDGQARRCLELATLLRNQGATEAAQRRLMSALAPALSVDLRKRAARLLLDISEIESAPHLAALKTLNELAAATRAEQEALAHELARCGEHHEAALLAATLLEGGKADHNIDVLRRHELAAAGEFATLARILENDAGKLSGSLRSAALVDAAKQWARSSGTIEETTRCLVDAARATPSNPAPIDTAQEIFAALGAWRRGAHLLEDLVTDVPTLSPRLQAHALCGAAALLDRAEPASESSEKLLKRALDLDRQSEEALSALIDLQRARDDNSALAQALLARADQGRGKARATDLLEAAELLAEKDPKATRELLGRIQRLPRSKALRLRLVDVWITLDDSLAAENELLLLVNDRDAAGDALRRACGLAHLRGDMDAEAHYLALRAKIDPKDTLISEQLREAYRAAGDLQGLREALTPLAAQDKQALLELADLCAGPLDAPAEAYDLYQRLLDGDSPAPPLRERAHRGLIQVSELLDRPLDLARHLATLRELLPEHAHARRGELALRRAHILAERTSLNEEALESARQAARDLGGGTPWANALRLQVSLAPPPEILKILEALATSQHARDDELVDLGRRARAATQPELAIKAYDALLKRDITHPRGEELVGLLRQEGRLREAANLLEQRAAAALTQEHETNHAADLLLDLAALRGELGQTDRRITALRQAAAASPGRRDIVKTLLAELRATDEDPSRILRTLEEQSAAAQGDLLIELLGELAELYLDLGEPAQAARTHETILRLAPKRVDLLPTLLDHAIEARQVDRARVLYDRARDTEAADDIDWLERTVSLAALEIDEDSHLPARERLESLVQREPEATSAWQLLRRLGERTQDVLLLGRAHRHLADLDPDRRQAHLRSAAAAYETLPAGRMQAQDIYQTLIALAPDDEEPWLRLETLLRDTQDPAILTAFLWRQAEHAPTLDRFLALERREAKSGAIDRSEEALRQACIVYPSHPLPLERLADRLEARHAFAELSELLSTYLETKTALEPATWGRLAIRLAKVLEEHLGLPDTAATWLVRVASTTPDNLEAPRRLIALRQRQGDVRSAIPFLQELIERSDGDVRAGLMSVLAQLQRDDLQDKAKAAETYRAAFRLSPAQHVNAGLAAIEIFEASREGPRALELIDEIMEVSPSPDLHHARGRALGNLGKLAAACQAYEHALEKPTPERHLELGLLLRRLGDDRKAASHLRRAADLFDDPVAAGEALYACGQALTTLGIRDAARQRYEEATEHDPGLRLAWAALLPLVSREREPKIFSHVLDALEALSPPGADRAELRFQRSEQARDEGNLEQAATHLEEALSDDPKHRASLHRLRDISLGAGSWSRAAELLRSEIEISDSEKERALLHRKLGILLERRLNANAEGLEHLRLASSIDPSVDNRQALLTALDRDGDHRAAARLALTLAREVEGSFGRESTLRAAQCYERAQDPDTARSLYAELAPLDDEVGRRAAARLADLDADRHDADRHDDWKEDEHQTRPLPNLIDVLDQLIADKAWPRVVDEISTRISQSSDPKTQADLHLTLARVLENELDQPKEALEAFDAAAELAPELSEVLEQAADAAYRHQRFRRARELYDQLWESSATLDRAEIAYRRGTIYEALGYEATANHCYAETLTFEANHRMALEARARLAIYRDDPQAAIEVFLQLSRVIGPTEPQRLAELRISLGELYLSQGETEKARARLEAALALDQHNEHALRLLLAVYEELGEHRAAADIAETLAAQIDDPLVRASLLHHRAMLLGTHLANEEEAINCLFRAYDIAPRHIPTLWRLVDYYWQEDDLASVRQMGNDLRAADALVAETPDTRQMTIALAFIADGMIEPSKTLFRAVLSDATLHESALQELVHGLVLGVDAKIIAAILHDIDGHEAFIEKAKALHEEGPSKTVIAPLLDALSAL
ncbi:MAG: hypothetical protein KAI47_27085 [Deltaproteobacteria bacterium]|nr:hypothetical protein [Deltaproteobacteria bacterium]